MNTILNNPAQTSGIDERIEQLRAIRDTLCTAATLFRSDRRREALETAKEAFTMIGRCPWMARHVNDLDAVADAMQAGDDVTLRSLCLCIADKEGLRTWF